MLEQVRQPRPGHTDVDLSYKNMARDRLTSRTPRKAAPTDSDAEESVPLFLSDRNGEPDPIEYISPSQKMGGYSISSRILSIVIAVAAIAVLFALFSSDTARGILDVKASIAAVLPPPSAAVQSDPSQPTQRERERQPNKLSLPLVPENQTVGLPDATMAAPAPTPEEMKTAYRSALQSGAPQAASGAEFMSAGDAVRHLDPNEAASSIRRGIALIASGDLAAARLVLRRPAEAGDAHAAMALAETYDPAILKKLDVHGVVPDVAIARGWYEKAKKFGATEAIQRLEVLASKQR
jgi:hypothetical protein